MSSVYESLKGTLQRSKTNSMGYARIKSNASKVNEEMDELEKIVADRIVRLRAVVRDGEAAVDGAAQNADQVIESLRTEITALEGQLEAAHDKELAGQKMEQTLTTKIRDLQSDVKKKEEALDSRGKEINELKSKIDMLAKQITQLETAIQQAKAQASEEAKRTKNLAESSMAKIAALGSAARGERGDHSYKGVDLQGFRTKPYCKNPRLGHSGEKQREASGRPG